MDLKEKLYEIVNSHLNQNEHFIVDIQENVTSKRGAKIVITLDGDKGIGIDDCAKVARKVSEELDALDLIDKKYTLEVSSPGVDQPLKLKRQYPQHIGRQLKVSLKDGETAVGMLETVTEEHITLKKSTSKSKNKAKNNNQSIIISFDNIAKVNVLISFN